MSTKPAPLKLGPNGTIQIYYYYYYYYYYYIVDSLNTAATAADYLRPQIRYNNQSVQSHHHSSQRSQLPQIANTILTIAFV